MREIPKEKEVYEHFKGNRYQILAIAKDANTMEELVVYQATYEPFQVFVRGLEEFLSPVDLVKYPDVKQEERFKKCEIDEEQEIDPKLMEFLDAETRKDKLEVLMSMELTITNQMINTMAMSIDVEIAEGKLLERYDALKSALYTMDKFEGSRLR
jgi:hypothetical protein